jgi:hypothetical protein
VIGAECSMLGVKSDNARTDLVGCNNDAGGADSRLLGLVGCNGRVLLQPASTSLPISVVETSARGAGSSLLGSVGHDAGSDSQASLPVAAEAERCCITTGTNSGPLNGTEAVRSNESVECTDDAEGVYGTAVYLMALGGTEAVRSNVSVGECANDAGEVDALAGTETARSTDLTGEGGSVLGRLRSVVYGHSVRLPFIGLEDLVAGTTADAPVVEALSITLPVMSEILSGRLVDACGDAPVGGSSGGGLRSGDIRVEAAATVEVPLIAGVTLSNAAVNNAGAGHGCSTAQAIEMAVEMDVDDSTDMAGCTDDAGRGSHEGEGSEWIGFTVLAQGHGVVVKRPIRTSTLETCTGHVHTDLALGLAVTDRGVPELRPEQRASLRSGFVAEPVTPASTRRAPRLGATASVATDDAANAGTGRVQQSGGTSVLPTNVTKVTAACNTGPTRQCRETPPMCLLQTNDRVRVSQCPVEVSQCPVEVSQRHVEVSQCQVEVSQCHVEVSQCSAEVSQCHVGVRPFPDTELKRRVETRPMTVRAVGVAGGLQPNVVPTDAGATGWLQTNVNKRAAAALNTGQVDDGSEKRWFGSLKYPRAPAQWRVVDSATWYTRQTVEEPLHVVGGRCASVLLQLSSAQEIPAQRRQELQQEWTPVRVVREVARMVDCDCHLVETDVNGCQLRSWCLEGIDKGHSLKGSVLLQFVGAPAKGNPVHLGHVALVPPWYMVRPMDAPQVDVSLVGGEETAAWHSGVMVGMAPKKSAADLPVMSAPPEGSQAQPESFDMWMQREEARLQDMGWRALKAEAEEEKVYVLGADSAELIRALLALRGTLQETRIEAERRKAVCERHRRELENTLVFFKCVEVDVPHDGNCQFEALRRQLRHQQFAGTQQEVRTRIVQEMLRDPSYREKWELNQVGNGEEAARYGYDDEWNFEKYLECLLHPEGKPLDSSWGNDLTLLAASRVFRVDIYVIATAQLLRFAYPGADKQGQAWLVLHRPEGNPAHYASCERQDDSVDLAERVQDWYECFFPEELPAFEADRQGDPPEPEGPIREMEVLEPTEPAAGDAYAKRFARSVRAADTAEELGRLLARLS